MHRGKLYFLLSVVLLGCCSALQASVRTISKDAIFNRDNRSYPITVGEYCEFLNDVASQEEASPFYSQGMNLERHQVNGEYVYSVVPEKTEDLLENATLEQETAFYEWMEKDAIQNQKQDDENMEQKVSFLNTEISNSWVSTLKQVAEENIKRETWPLFPLVKIFKSSATKAQVKNQNDMNLYYLHHGWAQLAAAGVLVIAFFVWM